VRHFELIDQTHDRAGFDCGVEALNIYLRQMARQHTERGISRTYVLVESDATLPKPIMGYFTLNICQMPSEGLPEFLGRFPREVAGIKLGRLAVASRWQRQGIGKTLLIQSMRKALGVFDSVGGIGLFVDAKDDEAKTYYEQFGFVSLPAPLQLFLPMPTVKQIVDQLPD
jgi:GNAT superfamily N-acetyltransferase